eukprot:TRINITY_DN12170_c0_g1_i1.p7 TRINITY_DN12170_c0_g1~~TRINITY_DN12170_c0_g1_i1.p7  ORF type:complete len:100 (+),score=1.10 TRINITY_DN12170_c0_g1_i1:2010-2309(+)
MAADLNIPGVSNRSIAMYFSITFNCCFELFQCCSIAYWRQEMQSRHTLILNVVDSRVLTEDQIRLGNLNQTFNGRAEAETVHNLSALLRAAIINEPSQP